MFLFYVYAHIFSRFNLHHSYESFCLCVTLEQRVSLKHRFLHLSSANIFTRFLKEGKFAFAGGGSIGLGRWHCALLLLLLLLGLDAAEIIHNGIWRSKGGGGRVCCTDFSVTIRDTYCVQSTHRMRNLRSQKREERNGCVTKLIIPHAWEEQKCGTKKAIWHTKPSADGRSCSSYSSVVLISFCVKWWTSFQSFCNLKNSIIYYIRNERLEFSA